MKPEGISEKIKKNIETKVMIQLIYLRLFDEKYNAKNKEAEEQRGRIVKNVVKMYYHFYEKTSLTMVIDRFKKKYIINETVLEGAGIEERLGLGEVYNYIQEYDVNRPITVFEIMKLHQLLFSKCPHPEGAGVFRTGDVFLPGSMIEIPSYGQVPFLLRELYEKTSELLTKVGQPDFDVINYIKTAIDIKAEIVRIHPFDDGNGRISRAFLNLLFKKADIPPVYVKAINKEEYGRAMNKALVEKDPSTLYDFYLLKILESIYELDIQPSLRTIEIAKRDFQKK